MGQGGKDTFLYQKAVLEVGRCIQWPLCHVSALLTNTTGLVRKSRWTPWLSCSTVQPQLGCQLGNHAVFILRGHSWPGISTDLAVPDSCEGTKQCWRAEAFVTSVESLEMQSGLSLCLGCGQVLETCLFSWLCFPSTAILAAGTQEEVWMQELGLLCHCQGICSLYHLFSFAGLGWQGWETTTEMSCCHF